MMRRWKEFLRDRLRRGQKLLTQRRTVTRAVIIALATGILVGFMTVLVTLYPL